MSKKLQRRQWRRDLSTQQLLQQTQRQKKNAKRESEQATPSSQFCSVDFLIEFDEQSLCCSKKKIIIKMHIACIHPAIYSSNSRKNNCKKETKIKVFSKNSKAQHNSMLRSSKVRGIFILNFSIKREQFEERHYNLFGINSSLFFVSFPLQFQSFWWETATHAFLNFGNIEKYGIGVWMKNGTRKKKKKITAVCGLVPASGSSRETNVMTMKQK